MTKLQASSWDTCSENDGELVLRVEFWPLMSKVHGVDIHACPVGGPVVLTSLNLLDLELDNLGKTILLFRLHDAWRTQVFCKNKASLISEGG